MECPKCHTVIKDNQTICPKCHKVLLLKCPNCNELGDNAVCSKCGYIILTKCSKCSKTVATSSKNCSKCGFPIQTSLGYQECESDEFAAIIVKFNGLKNIKRLLKSRDLYSKFFFKLKNLLYSQIKGFDCKLIAYEPLFVINLNKELSFATSSDKAVRLAIKIMNAFAELNLNIYDEFRTSLNLTLSIVKKQASELQQLKVYENNVKLLTVNKKIDNYLKGLQIELDQYVWDIINKNYKTDSLYSLEENGQSIVFYELLLDKYVLPPSRSTTDESINIQPHKETKATLNNDNDLYSFKVFDINAKCSFEKLPGNQILKSLSTLDFHKTTKIISLRAKQEYTLPTSKLVDFFENRDFKVLYVNCSEEMNYKPWGFFETLFKEYFQLPFCNDLIDLSKINESVLKQFQTLFDFICNKPANTMTPEDGRYYYMELWGKFLSLLKKHVIIIENFDLLDDTSIQTLELYFDKFKNIAPNFVFLTTDNTSVHSKIKELLRTTCYKEFTITKSQPEACLSELKSDATNFIESFYYEKICENFDGSLLYFDNAIEYLKETGVLIDFEGKLIIKNKKSVLLSKDLKGIYKSRIKYLGKNVDASLILAYTSILGGRLDLKALEKLGIKNLDENIKILIQNRFVRAEGEILYLNNPTIVSPIIEASLKKEAENFLVKNIIAQLGKGLNNTTLALLMGRLSAFKEEYLTLWKNSKFAILTGDYDAYLKNCLGFLSLVEHIKSNISQEEIEANKKEVYNNILQSLYSYSPTKIYFIEKVLLMDAINNNDDDNIVRLSNLMLQGALISANYTEALGLLHNILSRMPQPVLVTKGVVNTKFLLLSLVHIEILYNIGDFKLCVETAKELLSVLSADILDKIKPASFSLNLFVSHLLETFRLVGFAKLILMDDDIEDFFNEVSQKLNIELPEKLCIQAIKAYLSGKMYTTGDIENQSAFSKVIFLILQEFSVLKDDYKRFAQNIYQAKLLSLDIHQKEIELYCDLLIAWAYSKIGIIKKSLAIYMDVKNTAKNSAMFSISCLVNYFMAELAISQNKTIEAQELINECLDCVNNFNNQAKIFYALAKIFHIKILKLDKNSSTDIESEELKIANIKENLIRILN